MSTNVSINIEDLTCPILMDLFEQPISLPCCGKAISLQPFVTYHNLHGNCPLCKSDLSSLDPTMLPQNVNLAYMIEQVKSGGNPTNQIVQLQLLKQQQQQSVQVAYKAKMQCLCNNSKVSQSIIGKLSITSNKNLAFKTLLIVVVDESGSMGGFPNKQCKYSLHRFLDLTYKHKHLVSSIVTYDDTARITHINTSHPRSQYETIIDAVGRGGGTRFSSAFEKIVQVLDVNKDDVDISSTVIVFLTDGEDTCSDRKKLTNDFKSSIEQIWKRDYSLHTIGFGQHHDYNFLDGLRKIGTVEGAYRYADPSENPDMLSGKINSILDVIAQSCVIPIEIINSDINILSGNNSKYWCKPTPYNLVDPCTITIRVNGEQFVLPIEIDEDQNDQNILVEWLSYSLDKIIEEITMLSNNPDPDKTSTLAKQMHFELLFRRSEAIRARLPIGHREMDRIDQILLLIESVKTGIPLDQMKLNDLKYEGKFKTNIDKLSSNTKSIQKETTWIPQIKHNPANKSIQLIDKTKVIRMSGDNTQKHFLKVFGSSKSTDAVIWIQNNVSEIKGSYDDNGSNPLVVSSAIGRRYILEEILKVTDNDITMINQYNSQGYTALDLAIIFGYSETAKTLLNLGAILNTHNSSNPKILFLTCLKYHYFRTADVVIKYKLIIPTEELFEYILTSDQPAVEYLAKKLEKDVSLEIAIMKGLYDRVEEELPNIDPSKFTWRPYVDIFQKSTIDHVNIVKLLVENGKASATEIFRSPVLYEDGTTYDESVWPLFLSCKKGQYMMYSALIPYYDTQEKLNMCGGSGNTALMIASAYGHSDIVAELLAFGANPNIQNEKGDTALIYAIQKGFFTVVELLLNSSASLDLYNRNRDNPILIACRNGQAKILELLFNHVGKEKTQEYMHIYAEIDGFYPIFASVELDKLECIKVCHKFECDLEMRTSDDNKIIAGATPLHLAAHYGRLNALILLIDLGSNILAQTTVTQQTVLHIAINSGYEQIVRYLMTLEKGQQCLTIEDADGRLPAYYATKMGNDKILEEFFTNKMEKYLMNVLISDEEVERKCSEVLVKYGQTELCYEYDRITDNTNILTMALLNGNRILVESLVQIDKDMSLLLKKDEFGLNPIFWMKFIGYDISGFQLPESVQDGIMTQITLVKNVAKMTPHNALLCNFKPTQLKLLENKTTMFDIVQKQENGFGDKINDLIVANLKKSSTMNVPLIGFIEKLKSNRVFQNGEMELNYVMMDSKYNIIRRIASGESLLQPTQMLAIFLYTSCYEIFKQVNIALKNLNQTDYWYPFINTLYSALDTLPPYINEVYRGINAQFDPTIYAIGNTIRWNTFSVCSSDWKNSSELISKHKSGIVFIIHSKSGKDISRYSKFCVDKEVLFLPGSSFVVTNYYIPNVIALGQANIRKSTFKIKESDIQKAIEGKNSIIIELEEI